MKKAAKPNQLQRKLVVQRDVVAQLKPLELTQAVGGNGQIQTAPICFPFR